MSRIFKRTQGPETAAYVLPDAADLVVEPLPASFPWTEEDAGEPDQDALSFPDYPEDAPKSAGELKQEDPVSFAQVQAEALMREARRDVEAYREEAMRNLDAELEAQREAARQEGYDAGFEAGLSDGEAEAKVRLEKQAAEQIRDVKAFL